MDEDLVKQLQEAGFKPSLGWQQIDGKVGLHACNLLSELLEACKDFAPIITFVYFKGYDSWRVGRSENNIQIVYDGKTPEDALADLFIKRKYV